MSFDEIENLSNEQMNELYDDLLENSIEFISGCCYLKCKCSDSTETYAYSANCAVDIGKEYSTSQIACTSACTTGSSRYSYVLRNVCT